MGFLFRSAIVGVLVPSLLATGCLSSSYRLSRDELSRLARTAPEQRWAAVRVTQRMFASDTPPTPAVAIPAPETQVLLPPVYLYAGRTYRVPGTWQRSPTSAVVRGTTRSSSGSSSSSSSSSSSGGSGRGPDALAVLVVVVASAAIVLVLAGSEGARYDGWMGLPPDEPLYVDLADGSVAEVPLSALTPALADASRGAWVFEGTASRYVELERAPLDRRGFSMQAGASFAAVPTHFGSDASGTGFGFGGRAFLGGFPLHQLGLGATADIMGGTDGTVIASVGAEVQVMPITPVGVYAGVGWSSLAPGDSANRYGGWYVRGGVQGELPITTRLAASLRAGVQRIDFGERVSTAYVPEVSVGLSVY